MANHNPLDPLHAHRQIPAIEIELATARDYIRDDLKRLSSFFTEPYETFGLEDSVFGLKDLEGYRINNSALDIAEDLYVLDYSYGLTTNEVARNSVGFAFGGHHNEDFNPEYQFNGLLGKVTNDYIEGIRKVHYSRRNLIRFWQRNPEILEMQIKELKYEQGLTWNDITSKINEKYDIDWTTEKLKDAYNNNKFRRIR